MAGPQGRAGQSRDERPFAPSRRLTREHGTVSPPPGWYCLWGDDPPGKLGPARPPQPLGFPARLLLLCAPPSRPASAPPAPPLHPGLSEWQAAEAPRPARSPHLAVLGEWVRVGRREGAGEAVWLTMGTDGRGGELSAVRPWGWGEGRVRNEGPLGPVLGGIMRVKAEKSRAGTELSRVPGSAATQQPLPPLGQALPTQSTASWVCSLLRAGKKGLRRR